MDPFNLNRFVEAQEYNYALALKEIQAGRKESHWMWYTFPQLTGLGHSQNAIYYGISGVEEAQAYLAHSKLGPRLTEISRVLLTHEEKPIEQIFGHLDSLKLKSCMELFASVPDADPVFKQLIECFWNGNE